MQEIKGKKRIESHQEYLEFNFKLDQLEGTANRILDYLNIPKGSNSENQILVTTEQINSKYLKNLAETIEEFDEKLWDYKQINPQPPSKEIIYDEHSTDRYPKLLMYSSYLKSRKNPKILNKNELKRIKKHPFNPTKFQLEIDEEKYKKINEKLDKLTTEFLSKAILFPFKITYKILSTFFKAGKFFINKVDNSIEKYFDCRYEKSGTIPDEFFRKYGDKK
jgi:hypothetical protein